jgi:hypothetical protein
MLFEQTPSVFWRIRQDLKEFQAGKKYNAVLRMRGAALT